MLLYYFVIHASDHKDDDPDGTDLPNHQAAHAYAHRIIRELKEADYRPLRRNDDRAGSGGQYNPLNSLLARFGAFCLEPTADVEARPGFEPG